MLLDGFQKGGDFVQIYDYLLPFDGREDDMSGSLKGGTVVTEFKQHFNKQKDTMMACERSILAVHWV